MAATLTPNRDAALSALWWLFEGATFVAVLADASAADPALPLDGAFDQWVDPVDYTLDIAFDIFLVGGTADYDETIADRAVLPTLEITLDYDTSATYTDVLLFCIPAIDPGATAPFHAFPLVAVIHEPTAVTLGSTETKTYNVDLYSQWFEAT